MSIQLPSNFNLPAPSHIDRRTDLAKDTNDLRNWDFSVNPIPVGFEVCVGGTWYTFIGQSQENLNTVTGYFRERGGINVVQETGTSTTDVMSQAAVSNSIFELTGRVQEIVANLGIILEIKLIPVEEFSGLSGGLYEKGTSVTPAFGWKTYYNGTELKPTTSSSEVEGSTYNPYIYTVSPEGIEQEAKGNLTVNYGNDPNLSTWISSSSINKDTTYRIKLQYGTGVSQLIASLDITYTFINKRSWGYVTTSTVDNNTVTNFLNGSDGKIIGSDLSLSRELPVTRFNCSDAGEGVYPIYVVPSDIFNQEDEDVRVLVGNIEVSTYNLSERSRPIIINMGSDGYRALIFNVKQRGILNIEVKNYD